MKNLLVGSTILYLIILNHLSFLNYLKVVGIGIFLGGTSGALIQHIIIKIHLLSCPMCIYCIACESLGIIFAGFVGGISGGILGSIVAFFIPSKELKVKPLKELPPNRWRKNMGNNYTN